MGYSFEHIAELLARVTREKNDAELIEFVCPEEDYDIIPKPYPASKNVADWYKAIPPKLGPGFNQNTIKRCSPFLDIQTAGYIIPTQADIHIFPTPDGPTDGSSFSWRTTYGDKDEKPMLDIHGAQQVSHPSCPHPNAPRQPLKFLNRWLILTPPDYSLLFLPPQGKADKRFTCVGGIVDYPYYQDEFVNFPFFLTDPKFNGVIEAGVPMIQVIPFKKELLLPKYSDRPMNADDHKRQARIRRARGAHESLYRDQIHRPMR